MPRTARENMKGSSFFHIMVQGINRENIFNSKKNMKKYHDYFCENSEKIDILAYCIMPNHTHFLVYSEEIKNIENWMRKTNTSYALYYNKKNDRVGYVFRDRYKVQIIDNEKYLYTCIKYIHENPIKAGICKSLSEYRFSSFIEIYNCNDIEVYTKLSKFLKDKNLPKTEDNANQKEFKLFENDDKSDICKRIVKEFLSDKSIELRYLKLEKEALKELLKILSVDNDISYREIERNIGINKDTLRKIMKK